LFYQHCKGFAVTIVSAVMQENITGCEELSIVINLQDLTTLRFSGELAALASAIVWAGASVLFKQIGKTIRPTEMNLLKGLLAMLMLAVTIVLLREPIPALERWVVLFLLISGAVGIGLGDTAYFTALNALGARRALLLMMLAPPMTGLIALIFLGEQMTAMAWMGVVVTVAGVAWVITERTPGDQVKSQIPVKGIALGLLAALCQAGGAVLSRAALTQSPISSLQSSFLRLAAGAAVLILWMFFRKEPSGQWLRAAAEKRLWGKILIAVLMGTYICIWLQQLALRNAQAGVAQTLMATSPLFILPIAAVSGEKVTPRAVLGVVVAMLGISLLFRF